MCDLFWALFNEIYEGNFWHIGFVPFFSIKASKDFIEVIFYYESGEVS